MDHRAEAWYRRRTSDWRDWLRAELLENKQRSGTRISVVIPPRNEERTVASLVGPLRAALTADARLADELVVIDSDSSDATARAAAEGGAVVYRAGISGRRSGPTGARARRCGSRCWSPTAIC